MVFIASGQTRRGPAALLLELQRWLCNNTELQFATLLGTDGPLVDAHREFGDVRVRDGSTTPAHLAQRVLRRVGRHRSADNLERNRSGGVARPLGRPGLVYANSVASQTPSLVRSVLEDDMGLIVHVHESASVLRHRVSAEDLRWLLERADRIITPSEVGRRQLAERFAIPSTRLAVCNDFVEIAEPRTPQQRERARRELGIAPEAFVVAGSGRLDWRAAPELLAQILWQLRRERPDADAQVIWIGAGEDDRWQLEHDLLAMGLAEFFTFTGEQNDPEDQLSVADAFAITSREDTSSLESLRAAGDALPTVTFDTGGSAEFVADSGGGFVVPYPDLGAFAAALVSLVDDPDERRAVGRRAARHVADQYTVDTAAPELYEQILAVGRRQSADPDQPKSSAEP